MRLISQLVEEEREIVEARALAQVMYGKYSEAVRFGIAAFVEKRKLKTPAHDRTSDLQRSVLHFCNPANEGYLLRVHHG